MLLCFKTAERRFFSYKERNEKKEENTMRDFSIDLLWAKIQAA